jgi:hypothetical protein
LRGAGTAVVVAKLSEGMGVGVAVTTAAGVAVAGVAAAGVVALGEAATEGAVLTGLAGATIWGQSTHGLHHAQAWFCLGDGSGRSSSGSSSSGSSSSGSSSSRRSGGGRGAAWWGTDSWNRSCVCHNVWRW